MTDPLEELRQAIEARDLDRAATLYGPVWHERDGLRRMLSTVATHAETIRDLASRYSDHGHDGGGV